MALKFSLLVALAAVSTYGATIPMEDSDAVFDMVQSFLAAPDQFADAFGMTRVKRSILTRDFHIKKYGTHISYKFNDANNKLKGGVLDVTIDNLKKLVPQARSSKVVLQITFNGGDSHKDGLFDASVQYELHHDGGVEKGKLNVERKLVDGKWATDVSNVKTAATKKDIFPGFTMSMKSDYKTTATGVISCSQGNKYSINIKRSPGKSINVVITGMGKTYTIDGKLDKDGKKVDINIDAAGKKITANGKLVKTDKDYTVVVVANYGNKDYTIELTGQKDYKKAGLSVKMGDVVIASVELAGDMKVKKEGEKIVEVQNMKYLVSVNIMGFDKIEFKYGMQNGDKQVHKFVMQMKNMDKIEATYTRKLKENYGRDIALTVKKGGKKLVQYSNQFTPSFTATHYILDVQSQFDLSKDSKTYDFFCNYGCFTKRTMKSNIKILKAKPYKIDMQTTLTKDNENVLEFVVNTVNNPYKFILKAPRLLPKILPTGRKSIEFTADHQPGKHLKIDSNTNALNSFYVVKMPNGMRKVTLNGKELVQASFDQASNSITQTTKLPNGMEATTTVSWKSDNMKANDVTIKVEATERHMDAELKWDVTNMENIKMFVDIEGENKKLGKYHFKRDATMSSKGDVLKAGWTGVTSVDNGPLPSPIDTVFNAEMNMKTNDYTIDVTKNVAGSNYGFTLKNGRLSVNL